MKAPAFAYVKPRSLAEALDLLQNPNAKILAGGQSLIPSLNMRLSSPELLVDITGLPGLSEIRVSNDIVRVGALVTHTAIKRSPEVKKHVPLLAQAAPHIAHTAIRNRGTIGGSLALADPAAEYPACAVALDAVFLIEGKKGKRKIKAEQFFKGLFETDLKPGEMLTAAEFPVAAESDRSVFLELARRQGDYAIIGLAAHNERIVFFGVAAVPFVLKGFTDKDKAKSFINENLKPSADLYNAAGTKRYLAGVLLDRAWTTLTT
jgi:carbon-monoxide dehydrogenase medium subunit